MLPQVDTLVLCPRTAEYVHERLSSFDFTRDPCGLIARAYGIPELVQKVGSMPWRRIG